MNRLVPCLSAALPAVALALAMNAAPSLAQTAQPTPPPPPLPSAQATYAPTPQPTPIMPPGALPTPQTNGQNATFTFGRRHAAPTPAPPKETTHSRVGLSGVWEIALQNDSGVTYTHFKLVQKGPVLTGEYLAANNKKYPLTGSVDGKNVHILVDEPDGATLVFDATQEDDTDMMGTVDNSKTMIGFTAAYRPKYNWADSINPGGLGGMGGGGGLGGGGLGTP